MTQPALGAKLLGDDLSNARHRIHRTLEINPDLNLFECRQERSSRHSENSDRLLVSSRPAQPGASNPARFRGLDAEFNIGTAVGAVQFLPPGVYIAMNGRIWDPFMVRKNVDANRFEAAG